MTNPPMDLLVAWLARQKNRLLVAPRNGWPTRNRRRRLRGTDISSVGMWSLLFDALDLKPIGGEVHEFLVFHILDQCFRLVFAFGFDTDRGAKGVGDVVDSLHDLLLFHAEGPNFYHAEGYYVGEEVIEARLFVMMNCISHGLRCCLP